MAPIASPHALSITSLQSASLDHALWFHRDLRADEGLLFELDSPVAAGARGLGRALVHTRDGTLVTSCARKALIRRLADGEARREIREHAP